MRSYDDEDEDEGEDGKKKEPTLNELGVEEEESENVKDDESLDEENEAPVTKPCSISVLNPKKLLRLISGSLAHRLFQRVERRSTSR